MLSKLRVALSALAIVVCTFASESPAPRVTTLRVPDNGIQPQVVLRDGVLHLIYLTGAPEKADIIYRQSKDYGQTFSKPLQVNTKEFAMAIGPGDIDSVHVDVITWEIIGSEEYLR